MSNFLGKANIFSPDRRRAAFAGTWYEANPARLKAQLEQYLKSASDKRKESPYDLSFRDNKPPQGAVLSVVVPHAGYMFSGQIAAYAYDLARERNVSRVFVMGPSHYVGFQGGALPAEKVFATPLGDLAVDTALVEELRKYPMFEVISDVHQREHSVELQLPFIRQAFGDIKIVPLIIGTFADDAEIRLVGQILRRYINPDDLVVVSSDFTHYGPRYQYEPFQEHIRENVRKLDEEAFQYIQNLDLQRFLEFRRRTQDTICGFYPCSVMMAMLPENANATLLTYGTSQDTLVEDGQNSVSYLAIAFSDSSNNVGWTPVEPALTKLSEADKENLLRLARRALEIYVREGRQVEAGEVLAELSPVLLNMAGVFVTLYKHAHGSAEKRQLRGCIGYIWPVKPLVQAVIENAIGSASRDHRFESVKADELSDLMIDINVLSPPRRISSYKDIVIGRDGIVMYKGGRQSVFLPSVAVDFGWNLEQALAQLSIKAGCGSDGWRQGAQFDIFQSESFEEPH